MLHVGTPSESQILQNRPLHVCVPFNPTMKVGQSGNLPVPHPPWFETVPTGTPVAPPGFSLRDSGDGAGAIRRSGKLALLVACCCNGRMMKIGRQQMMICLPSLLSLIVSLNAVTCSSKASREVHLTRGIIAWKVCEAAEKPPISLMTQRVRRSPGGKKKFQLSH